jgi:hypothetical protein
MPKPRLKDKVQRTLRIQESYYTWLKEQPGCVGDIIEELIDTRMRKEKWDRIPEILRCLPPDAIDEVLAALEQVAHRYKDSTPPLIIEKD